MYHILICDDEQDIVNALKIYLMNPDFKLFEANTGVQALEVMEREDIHLILLDSPPNRRRSCRPVCLPA